MVHVLLRGIFIGKKLERKLIKLSSIEQAFEFAEKLKM